MTVQGIAHPNTNNARIRSLLQEIQAHFLKAEKGFELGLVQPGSADGKISTALVTIKLVSPSPNLFLAKATWGNRVSIHKY